MHKLNVTDQRLIEIDEEMGRTDHALLPVHFFLGTSGIGRKSPLPSIKDFQTLKHKYAGKLRIELESVPRGMDGKERWFLSFYRLDQKTDAERAAEPPPPFLKSLMEFLLFMLRGR